MTSSHDSSDSNPSSTSNPSTTEDIAQGEDLAPAIAELEQNVAALRQRYTDVEKAQAEKQELRVRINRAQNELRQHRTKQVKEELKALQTRMDELELTLESHLFSWSAFKEPFWQAIRFGGIGVVLGWILHKMASGS